MIEPLLQATARLLTSAGRFAFAIQHPAFNSTATRLGIEEDRAGAHQPCAGRSPVSNACETGSSTPMPRSSMSRPTRCSPFAERESATSFDAKGARYTHRDSLCSFEVLIEDYKLGA